MKKVRAWVADFETANSKSNIRDGVTWVWAWGLAPAVHNGDTVYFGTDLLWFLENIRTMPGLGVVYFHNANFDLRFIQAKLDQLGWLNIRERTSRRIDCNHYSVTINNGSIMSMTLNWSTQFGGRDVTFYDSHRILPFGLDAFADKFGLNFTKGDLGDDYEKDREYGYIPTRFEWDYLEKDVLLLADGVAHMLDMGLNKMTIGACALSDFKTRTFGKNVSALEAILPGDSDELYSELSEAYQGGLGYIRLENNIDDLPEWSGGYRGEIDGVDGWSETAIVYQHRLDKYIQREIVDPEVVRDLQDKIKNNTLKLKNFDVNKKRHAWGSGLIADINSMYPSIYRYDYLPCGVPQEYNYNICDCWDISALGIHPDGYIHLKDGRLQVGWYKVILHNVQLKNGCIPCFRTRHHDVYTTEKYISDVDIICNKRDDDTLEGVWLTSADIALLMYWYDVEYINIEKSYIFDTRTGVFDKYIDYWYNKKIHPKNEGEKTCSKLMLNNLTGKLGTKHTRNEYVCDIVDGVSTTHNVVKKVYNKEWRPGSLESRYIEEINLGTSRSIDDVYQEIGLDVKHKSSKLWTYVAIPAFANALGRLRMSFMMHLFKNELLYVAVDSLHLRGVTEEQFKNRIRAVELSPFNATNLGIVDDNILGAWKLCTFKKARYLDNNLYGYITEDDKIHYKLSGIPNKIRVDIGDGKTKRIRLSDLYWSKFEIGLRICVKVPKVVRGGVILVDEWRELGREV